MPRLVFNNGTGRFDAIDDAGLRVASGDLDVDFIPVGPGQQIVSNVRFVTDTTDAPTELLPTDVS